MNSVLVEMSRSLDELLSSLKYSPVQCSRCAQLACTGLYWLCDSRYLVNTFPKGDCDSAGLLTYRANCSGGKPTNNADSDDVRFLLRV